MTDYSFDYTLFPSASNSKKLRPVILLPFKYPVTNNETNIISFTALIDSGSDISLSYKEIGESLGMIFSGEPVEEAFGIESSVKCWKKPICVAIGEKEIWIDVLWMNRKLNPDKDIPVILGREKIFDTFDIKFCKNKKIVISSDN